MIQSNELRIGSYVNAYGEIKKVVSIGIKSAYCVNINGIYSEVNCPFENLEPLILTKDVLLKLDKMNDDFMIDKNYIGFVIFKNEYEYLFIKSDYPFLHQLQNLYFALTGEELYITL